MGDDLRRFGEWEVTESQAVAQNDGIVSFIFCQSATDNGMEKGGAPIVIAWRMDRMASAVQHSDPASLMTNSEENEQ